VLVLLTPVPLSIGAPLNGEDCVLDTVQETLEHTQKETVVCVTELRPFCTVREEMECNTLEARTVDCVQEESLHCVQAGTTTQCQIQVNRSGYGGQQEEEVEVCQEVPREECSLVKECREEMEECEVRQLQHCELLPHDECHQVTTERPRLKKRQVERVVCNQENQVNEEMEDKVNVVDKKITEISNNSDGGDFESTTIVSISSSATSPSKSFTTNNSKIVFPDPLQDRNFTEDVLIYEKEQKMKKKEINAKRKAANEASKIHFPEYKEDVRITS